jgi:hypothetical protein
MAGDLPTTPERFPFELEYQKALLRLLCEDPRFAQLTAPFLSPRYFENEVLSWAWSYAIRFKDEYGAFPTLQTIKQQTLRMDPKLRPLYQLTLEQVGAARIRDDAWLRDTVLDFVKRNIFVRAFHESQRLYNKNEVEKAYDYMMGEMERITRTMWAPVDDTWFYDDLAARQVKHLANDLGSRAVATGFDQLDHMMGGGLSKGELGIWVAYAKGGKSSMLMTHGVAATKLQLRPTAHFVFEGSRAQVEDRYEAALTQELYREVRNGGLSSDGYKRAYQEYQLCRGKLYLRGFTDEWNYSVVDIHQALKDLKRTHNWEPDLVIVDYGDLLNGREAHYRSEQEKQKAAFRDLKSLSNRGYAVWTASQAQRPEKGSENEAHWIFSRMIADSYEKVRVADFIGSLNACNLEKQDKIMRVMGELYRDNAADVRFCVHCDLNKMLIRDDPNVASKQMPDLYADRKLGVQRAQAQSLPPAKPAVPPPANPAAVQTYAALS